MESLYLFSEWQNYKEKLAAIDRTVLNQMKIFSYQPLSGEFDVNFIPSKEQSAEINRLYVDTEDPYAFFNIKGSKKYLMKVSMDKEKYQEHIDAVKKKIYDRASIYSAIILLIAILLAYYTLYPFKKALQVNEEFVRDMLHDINTPLSSMLINLNILKRRFGEDRSFDRMANNIETIESIQSNLRSFLQRQPQTISKFSLHELIWRRVEYFRVLYPFVEFKIDIAKHILLETNRDAFIRIIDNLISNAGKYNVKNGTVHIVLNFDILSIEDSGVGIKDTKRVFDRYYKEGDRGIGLGLHIVKKLAKELDIGVWMESEQDKGTKVFLKLSKVMD